MRISLYTLQQVQQVYLSQLMLPSVHGENRMREAVREAPRFNVTRATEPVISKAALPVESVTDEKAVMPAMFSRAMDGGYTGFYARSLRGKFGGGNEADVFDGEYRNRYPARLASSSYTTVMDAAGFPADYMDYSHGMAFDAFF